MPLVGRPMELIMPHSSSATRGGGLPMRYSRDTVLATSAPRRLTSMICAMSVEKHARGRHDRIFQLDAADFDGEIYHPTHSCRSNTGPSMQTRRNSLWPSTSKVRTQT